MFVPPALQQLLDPVFLADRQLFALDDSLRTLIDMTDTLEDLEVPAAVRPIAADYQRPGAHHFPCQDLQAPSCCTPSPCQSTYLASVAYCPRSGT